MLIRRYCSHQHRQPTLWNRQHSIEQHLEIIQRCSAKDACASRESTRSRNSKPCSFPVVLHLLLGRNLFFSQASKAFFACSQSLIGQAKTDTRSHSGSMVQVPGYTIRTRTLNFENTVLSRSLLRPLFFLTALQFLLHHPKPCSSLKQASLTPHSDYRDTAWRDGAIGPLGLAIDGSSICTARYLINGTEGMEVFIQTTNDAIHGRV
jgi:hypothetical protein